MALYELANLDKSMVHVQKMSFPSESEWARNDAFRVLVS